MKKTLYYCAFLVIVQVPHSSICMQQDVEYAQIRIHELQEQDSELKQFFDTAIERTLKSFYAQNGCRTIAEMKRQKHGEDELLRLHKLAYYDALRQYYTELARQQALKAAEFVNW